MRKAASDTMIFETSNIILHTANNNQLPIGLPSQLGQHKPDSQPISSLGAGKATAFFIFAAFSSFASFDTH